MKLPFLICLAVFFFAAFTGDATLAVISGIAALFFENGG